MFFLLFPVIVTLLWFVPGRILLQRLNTKFSLLATCTLSHAVGLVLWGIQGYIFGYLHVRFLSFAYVAGCVFLALQYRRLLLRECIDMIRSLRKVDRVLVVLIVVGVCVQSLQMFGTGLQWTDGMAFFRVHAQDGIFHLSLIESIKRSFPPMEPGASGEQVINYHYWSDMIIADLSRVFGLPIERLFFQLLPIYLSLMTSLALVTLTQRFKATRTMMRCALFFLFFGGDAAYLFMLYLHKIWGFYTSAIDNGATQFLNMPHAMAKYIFFSGLTVYITWIKERKIGVGLLAAVLFVVLFGIKIYFALFAALGMGFVFLFLIGKAGLNLIKRKSISRDDVRLIIQHMLMFMLFVPMMLAIYLPPNKGSGGLGYYPLEWPKLFLSEENLGWREWRYKYAIHQYEKNTKMVIVYDLLSIAVTLLCVHGTRMLGFLPTKKMRSFFGDEFLIFALPTSLLFTWLGLYTLQKSGGFNVFNFFAMSLSLLAIFAAFQLSLMFESKKVILRCVAVLVIVLTVPRVIFETGKIIGSYREKTDVTFISKGEQQLMHEVAVKAPLDAIVATSPENGLDMHTPYVSFYTNRQTFMSGQGVLETHNQPTLERFTQLKQVFASHQTSTIQSYLRSNKVSFLYVRTLDTETMKAFANSSFPVIASNQDGSVYDIR